jgi:hypothetical protein
MFRIFSGAALIIAGITAFIEAHSHAPRPEKLCGLVEGCVSSPARGLSRTAYDLLRIGAWALVIVGGLLVVTGLMRYWAKAREPTQ